MIGVCEPLYMWESTYPIIFLEKTPYMVIVVHVPSHNAWYSCEMCIINEVCGNAWLVHVNPLYVWEGTYPIIFLEKTPYIVIVVHVPSHNAWYSCEMCIINEISASALWLVHVSLLYVWGSTYPIMFLETTPYMVPYAYIPPRTQCPCACEYT